MERELLKVTTAAIICLLLFLAGCKARHDESAKQTQERPTMQAPTEVSKVRVDQAGAIYINGRAATLGDLKQELARLKKVNGGIWYYLENPSEPQAKAVEQTIFDAQVPIEMSKGKL